MSKIKQVIVVRKDLNMRKGKMISQSCHGSLKVFADRGEIFKDEEGYFLQIPLTEPMKDWFTEKFTKITVSVDSEKELLDIYEKAREAEIPCSLITDAGLTEFNGVPTNTVVAIGPDKSEKIDEITGDLKLL
jgi:PTH2 family peptidyl-tRNA hydrolase